MADFYVDPAAGGANDGGADGVADDPTDTDNWTDAWVDIQSAFDTAVAGDIVYCRGTQTLTVLIDVDTNQGDTTSGMISFIGVEGLLGVTGTRFVLDGNNAAVSCLLASNIDFIRIENFEFKNATDDGVEGTGVNSQAWWLYNCSFNNNGGRGFNGDAIINNFLVRCTFYGNSLEGLYRGGGVQYFGSFHDNTGSGVNNGGDSNMHQIGCLIYDNADDGQQGLSDGASMFNCVVDGNVDNGIVVETNRDMIAIIGCRITNHSGAGDVGLHCNGSILFHGWNYYEDNDGNNVQSNSLAFEILDDGVGTDVEDQADTNEGYTDKTDGAEDFNLRSDATSRRTAITIPTV